MEYDIWPQSLGEPEPTYLLPPVDWAAYARLKLHRQRDRELAWIAELGDE